MNLPINKIKEVLKVLDKPISLDAPVGEDSESVLIDLIEEKNVISPFEQVQINYFKKN